jgi:GntR family transcriptional regulator
MRLVLNFKSGKPVYLQLVDQIKAAAASGTLTPGDALPSIRPLAEELRVNRNTVAKAYAALEQQGIIDTAAGRGCFVSDNHSPLKREIRVKLLTAEIDSAVVQAHHFQIRKRELLDIVANRFDVFDEKRARASDE